MLGSRNFDFRIENTVEDSAFTKYRTRSVREMTWT